MRRTEFLCTTCGFELFHPIAELGVSILGLYSDARYPGRALLSLKEHYDDVAIVPAARAHEFFDDLRRAGVAIQAATGADRINYAILGNAEPHVHAHLIPRKRGGDPVPTKAPWAHPEPVRPLSGELIEDLSRRIASALSAVAEP